MSVIDTRLMLEEKKLCIYSGHISNYMKFAQTLHNHKDICIVPENCLVDPNWDLFTEKNDLDQIIYYFKKRIETLTELRNSTLNRIHYLMTKKQTRTSRTRKKQQTTPNI